MNNIMQQVQQQQLMERRYFDDLDGLDNDLDRLGSELLAMQHVQRIYANLVDSLDLYDINHS